MRRIEKQRDVSPDPERLEILIDSIQRYFEAWNRHDPEGVVATLIENGTYSDPTVPNGVSGKELIEVTKVFFTGFPDVTFEIKTTSVDSSRSDFASVQWLMKGTNRGPLRGAPPTGKEVALPGADFFLLDNSNTGGGRKIRSVQGYFDQNTLLQQLGLRVIPVPRLSSGPLSFGVGIKLESGKRAKPGAFSLTWIDSKSEAEAEQVRSYSQRISGEISRMPEFISWMGIGIGNRLFTVTAWENPEGARRLIAESPTHKEAMGRFFGPDFASAVHTGIWIPYRQNPIWVRCNNCQKMVLYPAQDHVTAEGEFAKCFNCGSSLPEQPVYW